MIRISKVGYTSASNVVVVNATTTAERPLEGQLAASAHWDQIGHTLARSAPLSRTHSFRQGMIHAVPFRTRRRVGRVGSGTLSQDGERGASSQLSRGGGNDSQAIPAGMEKIGNHGVPLRTRFVRFRITLQRPHVTRMTSLPLPVQPRVGPVQLMSGSSGTSSRASRRASDRGAAVS